jgi:GWxTD domain-containing protein
MAAGIQAVQHGETERAAAVLGPVVEAEPSCYTRTHGTAAYWLGRAHQQAGRSRQKLDAWAEGLGARTGRSGPVDARLIDAYVQAVFTERNGLHYERAAGAYLRLLNRQDGLSRAVDRDIFAQHLRLVAGLLSDRTRSATGLSAHPLDPPNRSAAGDPAAPVTGATVGNLPSSAGAQVAAWWKKQDPLPATPMNERMEEHLERVAYVRRQYQKDGRVDDRGRIYVRLGPPSRQTRIQFNSSRFYDQVLSFDSRFTSSDFKPGEFWVYEHIGRATQYLFVEVRRDVFRVGDVLDMLPLELRRGFSTSSRGTEEARAFVYALREAYSQLAIFHDRYQSRHQALANFALMIDDGHAGSRLRGTRTVRSFARRTRGDLSEADAFHARERAASTPRSYSEPTKDAAPVPVAVRHARFLTPAGRTQTRIDWSAPYADLLVDGASLPAAYLFGVDFTQVDSTGETLSRQSASNLVRIESSEAGGFLRPQTYTATTEPGRPFVLNLQWNQYRTGMEGAPRPGRRVGFETYQSSLLQPLPADASELVVSDLRPVLLPEHSDGSYEFDRAIPYPFRTVTGDTPLALYFEVYHLGYNSDDQTHYTVEYAVERRRQGGGFVSLFRSGDRERTTITTTMQGTSRTAEEHIVIDLGAWDVEQQADLTVTVRVIDETTDAAVERAVDFRLTAP